MLLETGKHEANINISPFKSDIFPGDSQDSHKKDFLSSSLSRHWHDCRSSNIDLNKTKVITGFEGGQTAFPRAIRTD